MPVLDATAPRTDPHGMRFLTDVLRSAPARARPPRGTAFAVACREQQDVTAGSAIERGEARRPALAEPGWGAPARI